MNIYTKYYTATILFLLVKLRFVADVNMPGGIPVVDLSQCGLLVENESTICDETFASIGKELYDVLATTGFAYLSNHGISQEMIDDANETVGQFFKMPTEKKREHYKHTLHFSYDPIYSAKVDMKHGDYNEAIRISGFGFDSKTVQWPNIPGFRSTCFDLAETCKLLLLRVLRALGAGMKLEDSDYFCKTHSLANREGNTSTLKFNCYPPVEDNKMLSENLLRLGEHTDWATLVFLFQDDNGGLQVETDGGGFVDVTPIPGTIILNVGETFTAWSGGRLRSTVHRVTPPNDPEKRKNVRRSIVYFGQANEDVLMERLKFDGDTENEKTSVEKPLTVGQHMAKRFEEVFQ